jgi:hypothetical protein
MKATSDVHSGSWRWQRTAIFAMQRNDVVDYLTELFEHLDLVLAVTSAKEEPRAAPDIASVVVRPLDDLDVPRAISHLSTPSSRVD